MTPLVTAAAAVPTVRIRFEHCAEYDTYLPATTSSKIRGALGWALKALAARRDRGQQDYYRRALRSREAVARRDLTGLARETTLHLAPYVLRVPWGPQRVGPDTPLRWEMVLFPPAADYWPAWVQAADVLDIGGTPTTCAGADVRTVWGWEPADQWFPEPEEAIASLGMVAGPRLPETNAVRVHLLSPTCWDPETNFDSRAPVCPAALVRALHRRVSLVADAPLDPEERNLRDRVIPGAVQLRNAALLSATAWHYSRQRGRDEPTKYGGLLGSLDLVAQAGSSLHRSLLDLLWLVQAAHLGGECTFGCGAIEVEPLE